MPPRKRKTKAAVQDATSSKKSSGPDESYGNAWLYFASMLGVAVCAMAATVMISLNQQHHVLVPFQGETMLSLPQFTNEEYQNERLWGSYRPQVYFGLRPKLPTSVVTGLMWYSHFKQFELRHGCEPHENLQQFGWTRHDGNAFGQQQIVDDGIVLTTEFVKFPGPNGGKWTARVSGRVQDGFLADNKLGVMTVYWYTMIEPPIANSSDVHTPVSLSRHTSTEKTVYSLNGDAPGIGPFNTRVSYVESKSVGLKYWSTVANTVHGLTDTVRNEIIAGYHESTATRKIPTLRNRQVSDANMAVVELTLQMPFTVDITFQPETETDNLEVAPNGEALTEVINQKEKEFDQKFSDTFKVPIEQPKERPEVDAKKPQPKDDSPILNDQVRMSNDVPARHATQFEFAKAAFSNLIGSMGYYYGMSEIEGHGTEGKTVWGNKQSLLTAVPSRSLFPRGFLWDEGFHQLLVMRWDRQLSKEVLGSWFDLMNANGWIAREQVLGEEARSKIPPEYITQKDNRANPPTFFVAIDEFVSAIDQGSNSKTTQDDMEFLNRLYPRLEKWYQWFNTTQSGPEPMAYRWRDRSDLNAEINPKTLTSGLDDFPRSSHPSDTERHLDLRCWMLLGASAMSNVAELVGKDGSQYEEATAALNDTKILNALHWSDTLKTYADWGNNTEAVRWMTPADPGFNPKAPKQRVTVKAPKNQFVNHFGYVSLFPFLMGSIPPTSKKLGTILADMYNPNHLWTDFGLRSLSRSSSMYQVYNTKDDAPYWRGTVWLNINYMAVKALHRYSLLDGPHQNQAKKMYTELRANIISNMHREYQNTGFIWEQYDVTPGREGKGRGTKPFTGWSSLVVLMMAELY